MYWARVPRVAIERVEVLRGGASDLYGSGALGGVIQVVTRPPSSGRGLEAEASAGGEATVDASLSAHGRRGDWSGRLSAEGYRTDGYIPVDEWSRGAVDTEAASRHVAVDATVERRALGDGRVFVRGMAYGEDRDNGTPLQANDTRIGLGAVGLDWGRPDRGRSEARLWGETQLFHQSFSAVASDRSSEDLTRTQRVPADAFGLTFQWSRLLGSRHKALAGVEAQQVDGETLETAYARGTATAAVEAGGTVRTGAFFLRTCSRPIRDSWSRPRSASTGGRTATAAPRRRSSRRAPPP